MLKSKFISGDDRFNFILALSGFLMRHQGVSTLSEAAKHFDVTTDLIENALRTLNLASAKFENRPEDLFYEVDLDLLETGEIRFTTSEKTPDVPHLTSRQIAALAAGLQYLSGIPEFSNSTEVKDLLEVLSLAGNSQPPPNIQIQSPQFSPEATLIRKAVLSKNRIRCDYLNQRGELTNRDIDPLQLRIDGQHVYLTGWCHLSNAQRVFRLDRMRNIQILPEKFSNDDFDLNNHDGQSYVAEKTDFEVVVEVQPEAYRLISEVQAIAEPTSSNSAAIRAVIRVGHLNNLGRLISRYGGAARVISPPEAREIVRTYALRMLDQNVPSEFAGIEE